MARARRSGITQKTTRGSGGKAVRDKGAVSGTTNARAVLSFKPVKRPRTLRALNPLQFVTLQRGNIPGPATAQTIAESKNVFYRRGHPIIRQRVAVQRLFRRDPYNKLSASAPPPFSTDATVATFAPQADQLSNNPNPEFHPESSPGAITVIRQPQPVVSVGKSTKAERTHGKVFVPNRQTQFGGKTLKKR